jgi:protein involved in polysaccharide export with SLBB domain
MTYQLGPGDLLELDLWGRLAKSVLLEVSPEGKIFLSGSGSIDVAGRTLAETRSRVLELVGRTFRGVRAELRLVRLRTIKVYVSGSVTKPGAYDATPVMRASEAVALAGTEKESSRRNITIRHRDGSASRLDLALFESTGDPRANPFLLDGDVVIVPLRTTLVEIGGAVMRPERFEWAPGDSLSTLLRLAGGPLPSAAHDRMLLVRFHGAARRDSIWLDGERVLNGSENPELADGDRFFVYFVADWHQLPAVEVYGEVNRPGTYPIVVGRDRLSDLLRWADGLSPRANRSAVHLLRPLEGVRETDPEFERLVRLSRAEMTESEYAVFQTKLSERRNSFRVDLDRIERDGAEVDPLLRETDIIRVDPIVHSVRVEGQVRRPGLVEYLPGRSVEDYVRLAGGYTNRASKSTVRVSRSVTGQVFPAKGVSAIQLGDFIWVPERRDIDAWAIFRDIVALAGQVAVIVVAVQGR